MSFPSVRVLASLAFAALVLSACASHGPKTTGGQYKLGAPYKAGGKWYVPAEQPDYEEVGIASWYGAEFNGRRTANGERFDMRAISGAHTTLPLPSIVEVTNLENGRSIRVRVNDRGPFHDGRIIDLSQGAAMALGFAAKGTARVRVRYVGRAPLEEKAPRTYQARQEAVPPPYRPPAAPYSPPPASYAAYTPPAAPPQPTGFAVQAGAFANRYNAEVLAQRLQSAGRADIRPIDRDGAILYRVIVGPWAEEAEAFDALRRISGLGVLGARVVRF